jgi:hypothetical protein
MFDLLHCWWEEEIKIHSPRKNYLPCLFFKKKNRNTSMKKLHSGHQQYQHGVIQSQHDYYPSFSTPQWHFAPYPHWKFVVKLIQKFCGVEMENEKKQC